jgi:hypothetical protein
MLRKIMHGMLGMTVMLCIIIARQPDEFIIEGRSYIEASPSEVFPYVNNLQLWSKWSPWDKIDPNAKTEFEGAEGGIGAVMKWTGNNNVGEGSLKITEGIINSYVKYTLSFIRPMENTHESDFTLTPSRNGTLVQWSMYGKQNFFGKVLWVLMGESIMRSHIQEGLEKMKKAIEKK